jgi:hypothetical protein
MQQASAGRQRNKELEESSNLEAELRRPNDGFGGTSRLV